MKYAEIIRNSYDAGDPKVSNERFEALKDALVYSRNFAAAMQVRAGEQAMSEMLDRLAERLDACLAEFEPYRRP